MAGSLFWLFLIASALCVYSYNVGLGIYDMTGPAVEINFMGYAVPGQRGSGIHLRLWARSYVIEDDNKRVAFVSVDGGMASDIVKTKVLEGLDAALGKGVYTVDNLSISGTHTHSGPAGFLQYVLFQATSLGFVKETFDAWVNGIVQSVLMAHSNMQPSRIFTNQGLVYDSNINRSPTSYLLNPESERAQYPEGDTDKTLLLLKFVSEETKKPTGMLSWYAVHATSMNNTNTLISGDNRGYSSYVMEKTMNGPDSIPGMGPFIAGFASTNLGDVSPNTAGPRCIDTGLPCDGSTSSCNGKCEMCIAFGPGVNGDMFQSTQIIGQRQFEAAKNIMDNAQDELTGAIDFRHSFVDMSKVNVTLSSGRVVTTCDPAMGYSFAAGTTDGPGMFNFTQGTTTGNIFWNKVRDFLGKPTPEQIKCQSPKPILINTGGMDVPYQWDPRVLPLQIFKVGRLFILSVPSEFTTMAGRRLRKAMADLVTASNILGGQKPLITIAGLANSYSSYVVTNEEYQAQRYEAASTIFGPHTLEAYIQEFTRIMKDLLAGNPTVSTLTPPNLLDQVIELMPSPKLDRPADGKNFGDVVDGFDAKEVYRAGDAVQVKFVSANPRNNQRAQGTFLTVERQIKDVNGHLVFKVVARDADWETKFDWLGGKEDPLDVQFVPYSTATITWDIPPSTKPGFFRICHFGDHKLAPDARVVPFTGCSSLFQVISA